MIARHLIIRGRVQGVGFRYALENEANTLGLQGWVRNRRDGDVEAHLEGPEAEVERLIEWAYHGPSGSHVVELRVNDAELTGLSGFMRLPTA